MKEKIIIKNEDFENTLRRMVYELLEKGKNLSSAVLVGVHRGGVWLAERLVKIFQQEKDLQIPVGTLDINLYRDDLSRIAYHPEIRKTEIPGNIDDSLVILVDDVIYTGRTVRCALDALMDLGRPQRVLLTVMVDRGGRELPIQPDVCGLSLQLSPEELVEVRFKEIHGEDAVVVKGK